VSVVRRDLPRTAMDWEVQPDGLRRLLVRLHEEYAAPTTYVTEFGAAYEDHLVDGRVDDGERVAFLDAYLRAVHQAMGQGADVGGVFAWSFLDNFEWAYGYDKRFGIVYVDYETQQRIPKQSALWYRDFIAARRAPAATGGAEIRS
jgi:beta-glucosidase